MYKNRGLSYNSINVKHFSYSIYSFPTISFFFLDWNLSHCFSLSVCLSVCLSLCISLCLSFFNCFSLFLSLSLHVSPCFSPSIFYCRSKEKVGGIDSLFSYLFITKFIFIQKTGAAAILEFKLRCVFSTAPNQCRPAIGPNSCRSHFSLVACLTSWWRR